MRISLKKLILVIIGILFSVNAYAQLVDEGAMDQSNNHSNGNYAPMDLTHAGFGSLGMIQEAWQDPLQNLGEGQTKPAYSKYYWTPDLVLPIRLREAMVTLINFPEWELIESVHVGDTNSFAGEITGPNTVLMYPMGNIGVDTNAVIFGRSGNKYVFYVRSEGVNTERLTNSIIDIDVVDSAGTSGGSPSSSSGKIVAGNTRHINAAKGGGGTIGKSMSDATFTRRFLKEDWLKSIPMDPSKFRFDVEIYVPNPDDVVIAPERVWHDDIFTYIDLGEKALNMTQRPVGTLIIERVETPVGFRTKGPNKRLIIVEGRDDMVMRSGKRMVCLKMRRSDSDGLQYATYAEDDDDWDIGPELPSKKKSKGSADSDDAGAKNTKSDNASSAGAAISGSTDMTGNGVYGGGMASSVGPNGVISAGNYAGASDINCDNMGRIDRATGSGIHNPYPQYKYGSGFFGQEGDSLSIELGTDSSVNNLEALWKDLSNRYSAILGGYEPFYSVDTPADGQGKELFHLRVGPIKSLDSGDSICSQLGRSGVFCSVVRVQ